MLNLTLFPPNFIIVHFLFFIVESIAPSHIHYKAGSIMNVPILLHGSQLH